MTQLAQRLWMSYKAYAHDTWGQIATSRGLLIVTCVGLFGDLIIFILCIGLVAEFWDTQRELLVYPIGLFVMLLNNLHLRMGLVRSYKNLSDEFSSLIERLQDEIRR